MKEEIQTQRNKNKGGGGGGGWKTIKECNQMIQTLRGDLQKKLLHH